MRFDKAGNMYFVEMRNNIVRKVDAKTKIITTIAGTGQPGFSGDGGPAAKAQLNQPHSISLDGKVTTRQLLPVAFVPLTGGHD